MNKLAKCPACGDYALQEKCLNCGQLAKSAHPSKYSKEDKYAAYRRKEKYLTA